MGQTTKFATYILLVVLFTFNTSCKKNLTRGEDDIVESLKPVEEVILIEGAENATIIVNTNKDSYFSIEFSNIEQNDVISNGKRDSWCIDVYKSINSNNAVYNNVPLYSTYLVEKWMPINYLLNIQEQLKENDQDLTWLEIQAAIWSLRVNPKFDLDEVKIENLPGQFHSNGQPTFSYEKVKQIVELVGDEYKDFDYSKRGTKFAVVAELPVDIQTVFAVVEKK